MISIKKVGVLLFTLLFLSGCVLNKNEKNVVLQVLASDDHKEVVNNTNQLMYRQEYEVVEEAIVGTKINTVVYRDAVDNSGISWLAAKVSDAQDAKMEVKLVHTYNQFNEKISTISVPGSKKITDATPTIYQYGAKMQPGAIFTPGFVTRYGYDCGGCTVRPVEDFSGTASGIKLGKDRVLQSNGQWKQGYTYDGYHIVATSKAIPLFSILKISNHPFSGGGITPGVPFYAIVGDRGVGGSSVDLFAGTETNLNIISQKGSPRNANMKVEVIRVGR